MSEPNPTTLRDIDIVILAGGLGTRIRSVLNEKPKVLAPIGGYPFLDILLHRIALFSARRVILSLGHGAQAVLDHIAQTTYRDLDIVPVVEPTPQGTAGALRFIRHHLTSNPVLVMNGDSFIDADLCALTEHHRQNGADVTLLCCQVEDTSRYGKIELAQGRIVSFREKTDSTGSGIINAGVYALSQRALDELALSDAPSLERDYFAACPPGTFHALVTNGDFIDIGTPESLARAPDTLARYYPA